MNKNLIKIIFVMTVVVMPVFTYAQGTAGTAPSQTGNPNSIPSQTGNPNNIPNQTGNPNNIPSQTGNPNSGTPTNPSTNTFYLQNPLSPQFNTVGGIVGGFLEIFSYIVILLAVLMLMWVGLQFILAQGNPERMNELKGWLFWIVIGVAVVIGARIIVTVVINTLNATGVVSPGVIQSANNAIRSSP